MSRVVSAFHPVDEEGSDGGRGPQKVQVRGTSKQHVFTSANQGGREYSGNRQEDFLEFEATLVYILKQMLGAENVRSSVIAILAVLV